MRSQLPRIADHEAWGDFMDLLYRELDTFLSGNKDYDVAARTEEETKYKNCVHYLIMMQLHMMVGTGPALQRGSRLTQTPKRTLAHYLVRK